MDKRFLLAWLAIFVAWFMGSFLVHGGLLADDYKALQSTGMFRSEQDSQQYFHWMILAHVLLSGAFVWIYARGAEAKPWLGQGVRFGAAVACLGVIPTYLIYYAVQPMPGAMVAKQIVFDTILVLILGAIAAFIYRRQ
jgi:hypothetical protein